MALRLHGIREVICWKDFWEWRKTCDEGKPICSRCGYEEWEAGAVHLCDPRLGRRNAKRDRLRRNRQVIVRDVDPFTGRVISRLKLAYCNRSKGR